MVTKQENNRIKFHGEQKERYHNHILNAVLKQDIGYPRGMILRKLKHYPPACVITAFDKDLFRQCLNKWEMLDDSTFNKWTKAYKEGYNKHIIKGDA